MFITRCFKENFSVLSNRLQAFQDNIENSLKRHYVWKEEGLTDNEMKHTNIRKGAEKWSGKHFLLFLSYRKESISSDYYSLVIFNFISR